MDASAKPGNLRDKHAQAAKQQPPEAVPETVAEVQATSGILVIPHATVSYVFPYMHLGFTKWERSSGMEKLTLHFGEHAVEIHGRRLGQLQAPIRDLMLREIQAAPRKIAEAEGIAGNTPEITSIQVKEPSVEVEIKS